MAAPETALMRIPDAALLSAPAAAPPQDLLGAGRLPNVVVIGAMKCGTTALHHYLDRHPDIAMSTPKELNFFIGAMGQPETDLLGGYGSGTWHRGIEWYAGRFAAAAPVRGESSPGYTSPDHPEVADRMARTVPHARLVYLVRDPVARAVSQYRHHAADGDERRPPGEALLDEGSQYLARGRYHERLLPFLARFPTSQIAILAAEDLRDRRRQALRRLFAFLEVDDAFWVDELARPWHTATAPEPPLDRELRGRLTDAFRDDARRLRELTGQELPHWSV